MDPRFISMVCLLVWSAQSTLHVSTAFKVAVFEHKVIFSSASFYLMSRQKAIQFMEPNLQIFKSQVEQAAKEGVNMIVFPEDGIYGLMFSKKSLRPFLEVIPNPKSTHWNPCLQKATSPDVYVQHFLSCLARNNSMIVVANMGEYLRGKQYNTDVAFDSQGVLLAKYHKYHLFYESQFDAPDVEFITFDTPIGPFGVATCFDLLFKEPVVKLIQQQNITNLVLPMAWMQGFPYLTAVNVGDAFARGYGINLLTANLHLPKYKFGGSGVFGPDGAKVYYYDSDEQSSGKLIFAEISQIDRPKELNRLASQFKPFHTNVVNPIHRFQRTINDAVYELVELSGTSGQLELCNGGLCCQLDFKRQNSEQLYVFGAADGKLTGGLGFNAQSCLLLKCANLSRDSCGVESEQSSTNFQTLRLAGDFRPEVVPLPQVGFSISGQRIGLNPSDWQYNPDSSLIEGSNLKEPVVFASLFARKFTS